MVKVKSLGLGILTGCLVVLGSSMVFAEVSGMEGYNHKYLPIGSVVIMDDGNVPLMIQGYAFTSKDGTYVYDYCGSTYPNGFEGMESSYCFDQKDVSEVLHIGYLGEGSEEFMTRLDEQMESIKAGNAGSVAETEQKDLPSPTTPGTESGNPEVEIVQGYFTVPSPLSNWLNDGWQMSAEDTSKTLDKNDIGSVVMTKNGYQITLYTINKGDETASIQDATVYQIDAATEAENLPLSMFNGAVYTGMKWEEFEAYLQEVSYTVEQSTGFDVVYLDADRNVRLTVFGEPGGNVWGISYCDVSIF